jgi:hypothetical protein
MTASTYQPIHHLGRIIDMITHQRELRSLAYGRPGNRVDSVEDLRRNVGGALSIAVLTSAHDLAVQLDLDDLGQGSDIQVIVREDGEGRPGIPPQSITLSANAYLLTARRTGLFRPGRSQIAQAAQLDDWTATANCWIRDDPTQTDWTEVGVHVLMGNVREPREAGSASRGPWDADPFSFLLLAAECHAARKGLEGLLHPIPCQFALDRVAEREAQRPVDQASSDV